MSLLKPKTNEEDKSLSIVLPESIAEEVEAYCEWVGFKTTSEFFEEAATFVLKRDRDWKAYQKAKSKKTISDNHDLAE